MSFGSAISSSIDRAVQNLINSGFSSITSAGNNNDDACKYSPGDLPDVVTVGATDNRDYRSGTSNFGRCVDVFAPGVNVLSTWNNPAEPIGALSGTSVSSPHVAGAAALYLEANPSASPQEVQAAIIMNATTGTVSDLGTGRQTYSFTRCSAVAVAETGVVVPVAALRVPDQYLTDRC
jgi:serine protease